MIELNSLSIKYDEKTILKDISLHIKDHLCILGANGSGKSTLAKALCDIVDYEGEIKIDSFDIKELSLVEKAKRLSYIPAKLEVYDTYITLEEFVLLGRFPYKKSFFEYRDEDKNKADENIKLLGLSHLKDHSVNSLSSGEQQLTLIAQALSQESDIIIFDEPTANLDPFNSKVIAKQIKKLKDTHKIILITHDLHLASYIDSPVLFIKNSKAEHFEDGFFNPSTLNELYGVEFDALAVKYE